VNHLRRKKEARKQPLRQRLDDMVLKEENGDWASTVSGILGALGSGLGALGTVPGIGDQQWYQMTTGILGGVTGALDGLKGVLYEEEENLKMPAFVCPFCTKHLQAIKEWILSGKAFDEKVAEQLCTKLPEPYQPYCKVLAKKAVEVVDQLVEKVQPEDVCKKFGLCPKTTAEEDANALADHITKALKPYTHLLPPPIMPRFKPYEDEELIENGALCGVCLDFMKWAKNEAGTYTVKGIMYLVEKKCPGVKFLSTICSYIMKSQVESIVNGLISHLPDDKICQKIKFC